MTPGFGELRTSEGVAVDEAASMLQKAIRRGLEEDALAAARALESEYSAYLWRRLKVITAEDVGPAEPHLPATIEALFAWWTEARKQEKSRGGVQNSSLFVCEAVLLLARAKKSRVVDDALAVIWAGRREAPSIPDYAVDHHTQRGRTLGRTGRTEAEYESSYGIANEAADVPNPYHERAKQIDLAPKASSRRRWLLGELHREYERLSDDAHGGDGRRWALELAGSEFGRLVSSSRELSDDECVWLLERLRAESTD